MELKFKRLKLFKSLWKTKFLASTKRRRGEIKYENKAQKNEIRPLQLLIILLRF